MVALPGDLQPDSYRGHHCSRSELRAGSIRLYLLLMAQQFISIPDSPAEYDEQQELSRRRALQVDTILAIGLCVVWWFTSFRPLLYLAGGIMTLAVISPWFARIVAAVWLTLGQLLGMINSRILLILIYLLMLTPIALLRRIGTGAKEALREKKQSAFVERKKIYEPSDFEKTW